MLSIRREESPSTGFLSINGAFQFKMLIRYKDETNILFFNNNIVVLIFLVNHIFFILFLDMIEIVHGKDEPFEKDILVQVTSQHPVDEGDFMFQKSLNLVSQIIKKKLI